MITFRILKHRDIRGSVVTFKRDGRYYSLPCISYTLGVVFSLSQNYPWHSSQRERI